SARSSASLSMLVPSQPRVTADRSAGSGWGWPLLQASGTATLGLLMAFEPPTQARALWATAPACSLHARRDPAYLGSPSNMRRVAATVKEEMRDVLRIDSAGLLH